MNLPSLVLVTFPCFALAVYAIGVYGFLPLGAAVHPDMRAAFEANRLGIHVHVFASAAALLIGPLQFHPRLRASRPSLHRWLGRLYLGIGVLVGGTAGLYMALHAFGGSMSRAGFACLALAWLYTGWRAYRAIRAGHASSHRRWMVRNFALTLGALTLRIWLPAGVASGVPFEIAYPVVAWLSWVPNLVAAEWLLRSSRGAPPGASAPGAR